MMRDEHPGALQTWRPVRKPVSRHRPGGQRMAVKPAPRTAVLRMVLAAGALVLVAVPVFAVAIAADASWLRPLLQHYIDARSHRRIDFTDLRIGLTATLDPIIRLRGLRVENAPWAAKRPFAQAAELRATLAWNSFWGERVVVKRLVLVDADIDLEQRADGLRNWRLTRPDDTGPGRIRIQSLDARRSTIRYVHEGLDLDVDTRIDDLAEPAVLAEAPGLRLTRLLVFSGRRGTAGFAGEVQVSDVLTFFDTALDFALRGNARTSGATLHAEGRAADLASLDHLDLQAHLTCASLADLEPLLVRASLPATRPVVADARVRKRAREWSLTDASIRIGASKLTGSASMRSAADGERRRFTVALRGTAVDLGDLEVRRRSAAGFDLGAWRGSDGRIDLDLARLTDVGLGASVSGLHVTATLHEGVLKVEPFEFGVFAGRVRGTLQVDATGAVPVVAIDASVQGVQLESLLRGMPSARALRGEVHGLLSLRSRGDSMPALVAASAGSVRVALGNASIPARLEARLALDGGRWFTSLFKGDARVPVHCAQATIDLRDGRGRIRMLRGANRAREHRRRG